MAGVELKVENRVKTTKSGIKKLRSEGKIPGVYYTTGKDAIPITIDMKDFYKLIARKEKMFDLNFGKGAAKPSILREIQRDPVTGSIIHLDMYGIKTTEKVVIKVPINFVGIPIGVKEMGGIMEHPTRELEIQCLPKDIPNSIDVDVSEIGIHESLRVEDLTVENVEVMSDPRTLIAHVVPPKVEKEVVVEEEEELVEDEEREPEVITAKEETEEEE